MVKADIDSLARRSGVDREVPGGPGGGWLESETSASRTGRR